MEDNPLVSVIITTYYRNQRLSEAINSVIEQTYSPIEIIVIDDSGEKSAKQVVNDYEVKYIAKSNNEGQISAWNAGISVSNGKFIQFMDDDDKLSPTKIEKQISEFRLNPSCGVVYCGMKWQSGSKSLPDPIVKADVLTEVLSLDTSPCVTSSMLMKRPVIEKVYPIPEYEASTDDVLKIELAQVTDFGFVNECLIIRGEGEDSVDVESKVTAWKQILSDYKNLYNESPDFVYNQALANIYYKKGSNLLKTNFWSIKARMFLLYSLYFSPTIDKKILSALLRSTVGYKLHNVISSMVKRLSMSGKMN